MTTVLAGRLRFDTEQAADYAGRSTDTIRRALQSGDLHGGQRKVRGHWSIRKECLDAWLDGERCPHQPARAG